MLTGDTPQALVELTLLMVVLAVILAGAAFLFLALKFANRRRR